MIFNWIIVSEIGHVDNVLALSEERDQQVFIDCYCMIGKGGIQEEVKMDQMIYEEGWEKYKKEALSQMTIYNNEIKVR